MKTIWKNTKAKPSHKDYGVWVCDILQEGHGCRVAQVSGGSEDDCIQRASLIKAAPFLLEALIEARRILDDEHKETYSFLNIAIAKAQGQQD